jgi:hypothetical protein
MSKSDRQTKIEEIVARNTERHVHMQEMEDFESYYRENILQALDDVVRQVASERAAEPTIAQGPKQMKLVSTSTGNFFARFEGAYQSLMEAMFPGLALHPGAIPVRSSREMGTEPSTSGAEAPNNSARSTALSPSQEVARSKLPAWVVVPYADAILSGTEFAILWAGEGETPDLPHLELRLDGKPQDENVFWLEMKENVFGLPLGQVPFVRFDQLTPQGCTIIESEDGRLVIDFRS